MRGHSTPEAAAKAWGNSVGIVNAGGTLYWEVQPEDHAYARRRPFNLGVGRETGRGRLVTGYGANGHHKGWLALSAALQRRQVLVEQGGRWFAKQPDEHGNMIAQEGCTRCSCGCKYWENDRCHSCGLSVHAVGVEF